MSLAVMCDSKKQREHALQVAMDAGIAYGSFHDEIDAGNVLRVYNDGDWQFLKHYNCTDAEYTFTEFIEKYGMYEAVEKPPIGLRPRFIVEEERIREISNAINRYAHESKKIPQEWLDELIELNSRKA